MCRGSTHTQTYMIENEEETNIYYVNCIYILIHFDYTKVIKRVGMIVS